MAEKEERIYLFTDKIICENCKDWYEHIDPLDSPDCTECAPADFPYITRSEAIERMAKALFKVDNVLALDIEFEQLTKRKQLAYKVFAEAELNALLGDK